MLVLSICRGLAIAGGCDVGFAHNMDAQSTIEDIDLTKEIAARRKQPQKRRAIVLAATLKRHANQVASASAPSPLRLFSLRQDP